MLYAAGLLHFGQAKRITIEALDGEIEVSIDFVRNSLQLIVPSITPNGTLQNHCILTEQ